MATPGFSTFRLWHAWRRSWACWALSLMAGTLHGLLRGLARDAGADLAIGLVLQSRMR